MNKNEKFNRLAQLKLLVIATIIATIALVAFSTVATAQRQTQRPASASARARSTPRTSRVPLPRRAPLPVSVDPFAAIEQKVDQGQSFQVEFKRTPLDTKAEAKAQVALNNGILLVRMDVKNLPTPDRFDVPRYALWVYVPNYGVKMYIGDLPVIPTSAATETIVTAQGAGATTKTSGKRKRRVRRGESDSAYRFTALPPDAEFGGLMLTAEPVRYTPIVNEALRPVLVSLTAPDDPRVATAPAIYAKAEDYFRAKKSGKNVVKPVVVAPRRRVPSVSLPRTKSNRRRTP